MFLKVMHIGVAAQKPEKFMDDALQVEFFGGEKREALFEIKSHLMAEDALRASSSAVGLDNTVVEDFLQ